LAQTGQSAQDWVAQNFTWGRKAEQVLAVYEAVLSGAPMPAFFDAPATTATCAPWAQGEAAE
jgi:hypothetical protein